MALSNLADTILIFKPADLVSATVLECKRNQDRLVVVHHFECPSTLSLDHASASRECTPFAPPNPEKELHLKFDPKPKDCARGFVFGADCNSCDVVLQEEPDLSRQRRIGVSRQHFSLEFNWRSGFILINNFSQYGTGIKAPSIPGGYELLKHGKKRMLNVTEQTKIYAGSTQFEVHFPSRNTLENLLYEENWQAFRAQCMLAVPGLDRLCLQSAPQQTPFMVRRESRHSSYFFHGEIGKGHSSMVCMATNCCTGESFAAKWFMPKIPELKDRAYAEVALSKHIEHIVSFIDDIDDETGVALLMEYLPMGNLMEAHDAEPISEHEAMLLCQQTLQALEYLHEEKKITHRDIKPENILMRSRSPSFLIKLCDFGLSTQKSIQRTWCGTQLYLAPEQYSHTYTNAVDVWAIGVVALQFLKSLPSHEGQSYGPKWCEVLHRCADLDGLPLLKRMLELEPRKRPSARECLKDILSNIDGSSPIHQSYEIISASQDFVSITVDGCTVYMRKRDGLVNATQITRMSRKPIWQQQTIRKRLKKNGAVTSLRAQGDQGRKNDWVSITCARDLCASLGLAEKLQPLLAYGLCFEGDNLEASMDQGIPDLANPMPPKPSNPEYFSINLDRTVMVRKSDLRVNATHLMDLGTKGTTPSKTGSTLRYRLTSYRRSLPDDAYDIVKGHRDRQGTYVDLSLAVELCNKSGLTELKERLISLAAETACNFTLSDPEAQQSHLIEVKAGLQPCSLSETHYGGDLGELPSYNS